MYDEDSILDSLKTVLLEEQGYTDTNVVKGNPAVLDRGYTKCIILDSGRIENMIDDENAPFFMLSAQYTPIARVFYKYTFDEESRRHLREETKAVMSRIDSHPTLSGAVQKCHCEMASEPAYLRRLDGSGPLYIYREISVSVLYVEPLTINE